MRQYEHGGNIYAHPTCVDFSANRNPLGMPAAAREALRTCADACEAYPDPQCAKLTDALAAFEHVPREWMLPCAGATDAFVRICLALLPSNALVCDPCYSGYEQALELVDAHITHHKLQSEEDFAVTERLVDELDESVNIAFLANPNNPTGLCVPRVVMDAFLERAAAQDAVVVLDECFVDLTDNGGSNDLLERFANLVIVKALTKSFCLAGLRVGYAMCSDEGLLARLRLVGQPWAVSAPAQLAGAAALADKTYLQRSRGVITRERIHLMRELRALGLRVVPGEANYLLLEADPKTFEKLLQRGILVRPCDNFNGLDKRWLRVAIRTSHQNDLLLRALKEVAR